MLPINSFVRALTLPLLNLWIFFWLRVPDRCKRLLVLTSLYVRLKDCTEDDLRELNVVNRELALSRDPHALRFPALLAPWLWKHVLPLWKIDQEHHDQYITKLLRKTPCWLWYADPDTRRDDLQRLVQVCMGSSCTQAVA